MGGGDGSGWEEQQAQSAAGALVSAWARSGVVRQAELAGRSAYAGGWTPWARAQAHRSSGVKQQQ